MKRFFHPTGFPAQRNAAEVRTSGVARDTAPAVFRLCDHGSAERQICSDTWPVALSSQNWGVWDRLWRFCTTGVSGGNVKREASRARTMKI